MGFGSYASAQRSRHGSSVLANEHECRDDQKELTSELHGFVYIRFTLSYRIIRSRFILRRIVLKSRMRGLSRIGSRFLAHLVDPTITADSFSVSEFSDVLAALSSSVLRFTRVFGNAGVIQDLYRAGVPNVFPILKDPNNFFVPGYFDKLRSSATTAA